LKNKDTLHAAWNEALGKVERKNLTMNAGPTYRNDDG
jgi:hypothetical protein